ncbi:Putative La domain containing protein [Septoria linicola]|uniref:La domain containing protein n=1 Tax=Septoria linicola TaxID=215465 RepID=A0A9Q9AF72_9PEZI|nr:Putative La domain containing protein [Septoria linicola]
MAASNQSPSGFSYAQAAKGQTSTATSQAPSSKVTSGAATPATGTFSELGPNSNWADDIEATTGDKQDARKTAQEQAKAAAPAKADDAERITAEGKPANGVSGVSSPDLVATPNTTTNSEDSSSAPQTNGSSETTWETKSDHSAHNSEPSWIVARKERQDHEKDGRGSERPARKGKKGDKSPKEPKTPKAEAKPIVYTEAAPPPVNPWAMKRAEAPKPKPVVVPQPSKAGPPAAPAAALRENQRPQVDTRKKANSITSTPREAESGGVAKKAQGAQGKRIDTKSHARQGSKSTTETARADPAANPAKVQREPPNPTAAYAAPPSVRDESSWPTPDKAEKSEDKTRKDVVAEKTTESGGDNEANGKPREKTKWTAVPVTPTIVWATEEMNRPQRGAGGERGGRGGTSTRGRGGQRGGADRAKAGGDRAVAKKEDSPNGVEHAGGVVTRGRTELDREAMPPPAKPARKANASGSRAGSRARGQSQVKAASPADESVSKNATYALRTGSPAKMDSSIGQDAKSSETASRSTPKDFNTTDIRELPDALRDTPVRKVPTDGKKFENYNNKEWSGAPRGSKRGGRGRGGSREFANGHQTSQAFANGHDYASQFGVPQSPSTFQSPRGGFAFGQPGRGSWRGNPRSQSIPIDQVYGGRYAYGPPMQTYFPGMYDYSGLPMSAVPFAPVAEQQYLFEMVSTQLEYYFSIDNLLKDMFLRKNMDSQGFVFLDVITNFNRIKQLSADPNVIKAACLRSDTIEIKTGEDGKDRLRRQEGWEQFVMPMDQREVAAQTEGPQSLMRPEPPSDAYPAIDAFRGPASAGLPGSQRRSYDAGYAMNGAVPGFAPFTPLHESAFADFTRGEEDRGRAAKSPIRENGDANRHSSLNGVADAKDGEADVFPDEQASTLTVVVRLGSQRPQHAAARTFSNGSIDTRSIFGELEKAGEEGSGSKPTANGEPATNGDHPSPSISRHASPSLGRSPEKSASSELPLLWIKNSDRPHEALPHDTTLEPYVHLRFKALKQRDEASTGNCPYDLDVLYQFWSHFLIRNYNHRMYGEFKYYATDDVKNRSNTTGMQNLLQFYAKALASSTPIRDHIVKDYVELVKAEPAPSHGQGFKALRQAWRNGALNLKNRKKLNDIVDEELRKRLES